MSPSDVLLLLHLHAECLTLPEKSRELLPVCAYLKPQRDAEACVDSAGFEIGPLKVALSMKIHD